MKLHICQLQAIERYVMAQYYRQHCIGLAWAKYEVRCLNDCAPLLPRESRAFADPLNFLDPEFFTEEERLLAVQISIAS
jgi:hypothetical protein